jgi:hypothetical protein
LQTIVLNRK